MFLEKLFSKIKSNIEDKFNNENKLDTETIQIVEAGLPNIQSDFKVLFFADTHNSLDDKELDELEEQDLSDLKLVVFLGDIGFDDYLKIERRTWYENTEKIGVLGNHDGFGDLEKRGVTNLDSVGFVNMQGVCFGGFGGSLRYKDSDVPLLTDEESVEKANSLPILDVFLTHDGPKDGKRESSHAGLLGISRYIEEKSPAYHFYGHRHRPETVVIGRTKSSCEYRVSLYSFTKDGTRREYESLTNHKKRMSEWLNKQLK